MSDAAQPQSELQPIRTRLVTAMRKSAATLAHVLANVRQEQAVTLRDGADGWTVLEVACHLRDFDEIFYGRAVMIVEQEYPTLPAYDHEALVVERRYNEQSLAAVVEGFTESRRVFADFFAALTPDQWERAGLHAERGRFTLTDAALQVPTHDLDHLEQITRILRQG